MEAAVTKVTMVSCFLGKRSSSRSGVNCDLNSDNVGLTHSNNVIVIFSDCGDLVVIVVLVVLSVVICAACDNRVRGLR